MYTPIVKKSFYKFFAVNTKSILIEINNKSLIKYFDLNYLYNKINNSIYVQKNLNIYCNKQIFVENLAFIQHKKSVTWHQYIQTEDLLLNLIEHILYIGIEWYLYSRLQVSYFYRYILIFTYTKNIYIFNKSIINGLIEKFLFLFIKSVGFSKCSVNFKQKKNNKKNILFLDTVIDLSNAYNCGRKTSIIVNQDSIKYLFYQIRKLIYHKNRIGHWRINNYLTYDQAINKIKQITVKWYTFYSSLLGSKQLSNVNNNLDDMLYCWKSKKN